MFPSAIFVAIYLTFISLVVAVPTTLNNSVDPSSASSMASSAVTNGSIRSRSGRTSLGIVITESNVTTSDITLFEGRDAHRASGINTHPVLTSGPPSPTPSSGANSLPSGPTVIPRDLEGPGEPEDLNGEVMVLRPLLVNGSSRLIPVEYNLTHMTVRSYAIPIFNHTGSCDNNHGNIDIMALNLFNHASSQFVLFDNHTQNLPVNATLHHLILPSHLTNLTHRELESLLLDPNRTLIRPSDTTAITLIWTHHIHTTITTGNTTHNLVPRAVLEKRRLTPKSKWGIATTIVSCVLFFWILPTFPVDW